MCCAMRDGGCADDDNNNNVAVSEPGGMDRYRKVELFISTPFQAISSSTNSPSTLLQPRHSKNAKRGAANSLLKWECFQEMWRD